MDEDAEAVCCSELSAGAARGSPPGAAKWSCKKPTLGLGHTRRLSTVWRDSTRLERLRQLSWQEPKGTNRPLPQRQQSGAERRSVLRSSRQPKTLSRNTTSAESAHRRKEARIGLEILRQSSEDAKIFLGAKRRLEINGVPVLQQLEIPLQGGVANRRFAL